tara:strand:+ start:159 stop:527 length:369 start_codon:yes stop_codon:yes gene_type:complete
LSKKNGMKAFPAGWDLASVAQARAHVKASSCVSGGVREPDKETETYGPAKIIKLTHLGFWGACASRFPAERGGLPDFEPKQPSWAASLDVNRVHKQKLKGQAGLKHIGQTDSRRQNDYWSRC